MHYAFIPYGARQEIERLMRDIESQKFQLRLEKDGKKKAVWVNGQIRELPFGVKEIVFPKEYKDLVLNTMMGNTAPNRGKHHLAYKPILAILRKGLKLEPVGDYNKEQKLLWDLEYVSIMPLGIREDGEVIEQKDMGYKDYTHEAL